MAYMNMLIEIIWDAGVDCLKMLPFLFAAFLLMELLEQYSGDLTEKILGGVGRMGPVVGAVLGCIPQCGFSVLAANLYAGGILSLGTLLSVFLATSDEALLIILGTPEVSGVVGRLLAVKVVIAVVAGYIVDLCQGKRPPARGHELQREVCRHCEGKDKKWGSVVSAWNHTIQIFGYLFVFTVALNWCIEMFGFRQLSQFFLEDSILQPAVTALIGMIPNCAASVILTQLYLKGAITFASVVAGLSSGAGIGLALLFRVNPNRRENLRIAGLLYGIAAGAGILLEMLF